MVVTPQGHSALYCLRRVMSCGFNKIKIVWANVWYLENTFTGKTAERGENKSLGIIPKSAVCHRFKMGLRWGQADWINVDPARSKTVAETNDDDCFFEKYKMNLSGPQHWREHASPWQDKVFFVLQKLGFASPLKSHSRLVTNLIRRDWSKV